MKNWRYKLLFVGLMIGIFSLPAFAHSTQVKIESSFYPFDITTYLYTPSGNGPFPAVIVLHTIAGMKRHVFEFAAGLSRKGYVTLAVDYFSGNDQYPIGKLGFDKHIVDAYHYLATLPIVDAGRIGMVGFSLGSRKALAFAMNHKRQIKGIVNYDIDKLAFNDAGHPEYPPILFLHGELDQETDPEVIKLFCEAQKRIHKVCQFRIYRDVKHAFDDRTNSATYESFATADEFKRALTFLDKYVKGKSK